MNTDRDLKMGQALASIPVPELPEGYYSRLVTTLERERPAAAPRRRRVLRFGLAAAAVAAAVTVAVVLFGLPGVRDSGPQVSLAAQVLAKMSGSLGAVRSFTADDIGVDYQNGDAPVTSRSRVYLAANGDGRVEDEHGKWAVIHNAALGTQWTLERVDGRLVATQVSTGSRPAASSAMPATVPTTSWEPAMGRHCAPCWPLARKAWTCAPAR